MELKDKLNLVWKFAFLGVFTYGVMSAVCCMKSCNTSCSSQVSCCKSASQPVAKQCGTNCVKPCCATK